MLDKLRELRKAHLKTIHDLEFYPYQEEISDRILKALVQNLRLTNKAKEEDIKKLKPIEISIEISRQAGKTTAVVMTIDFIMNYFPKLFDLKKRLEIGIFAPQYEQAKTDFDRLKEALNRSAGVRANIENIYKEENNAKTIGLPGGATCHISPISKTSLPESKSLALIIFEENQDADDEIVKTRIFPMGATTNAPRVYVGTAGTRVCYFYRLGQTANALKIYFEDVAKQRRQHYNQSTEASHLIYEQYIRGEIEKHGLDSDEIQRPYFGKWLIGTGNFCTEENLKALITNNRPTYHYNKSDCFAGIDTAKHPDSTVCTVIRDTGEVHERVLKDGTKQLYRKKELLNWCELRGENYRNQYDILKEFLSHYRIEAIAIDSTGQGDFMPDMFETDSEWRDEHSGLYRLKFSATTKDIMYKNLKVQIQELLTTLPNLSTKIGERFRLQMLDLQQEYKGNLLSVHHPDAPDAHDDFADSWALAEWAFSKWYADNQLDIHVLSSEKERRIEKNENNEVVDYWPGLN